MDDILKHKEVIEFEEIVKDLTVGQSLFIEGHPGSGKTTFVNKITQHWALSPDGAIRIMLLVSLRVLNTLNKCNLDLSDILKLFHDLKGSKDLIEARNGEGVCFIFDGLDEFSPQDGKKSLVYKIINKEYLDRSTVIVASRPAAIAKLRSKADKVIEVLGFRKEQIIEYFYHYPFSDDLKPEELEAYLSVHHNILHMCYLPIHAAMVAFVFQVNGEVPQTETEIYTHFTRFTIMRSLSKTREVVLDDIDMYDLEEEDERYLGQICKLALEMTILNKQVLHQEEAMQFFKKQKGGDISLGLITIDRVAGLYGFKDIYTFLHLTFQEYLAACHVLTLGNDEQESLIQEHGGKNHMLMVWKFYCGLLRSGLGRKIVSIVQQTSGKFLFHSQCAYESQDKRACDYVLQSSGGVVRIENQCLKTPDLTAISFVSVKPLIPVDITLAYCNIDIDPINSEYIPNILRLFLFQLDITSYAFENLLRFCSNSNIQKLKIIDTLTGLKDAEVLAFYIRNYTNLKELDISNNAMGDTGMIAVASNLCKCINLEKLVLSENQLTAASGVFKKVFCNLRNNYLKVNYADFSNGNQLTTRELIAEILQVNLQSLCITVESSSIPYLTSECKNWGNVRKLNLNRTKFCNADIAVAVTNGMHFQQLEDLTLADCKVSTAGAKAIAVALSQCSCLQRLDLSLNSIGDDGARAIFRCCLQDNPSLLHLNLNSNLIGDDAMTALSLHPIRSTSLQTLNLGSNNIEYEGIVAIASCLSVCTSLRVLKLNQNNINAEGAFAFSLYLKHFSELQELHMGFNHIGEKGARALAANRHHCPLLKILDVQQNDMNMRSSSDYSSV